jgi:hypothetical protein
MHGSVFSFFLSFLLSSGDGIAGDGCVPLSLLFFCLSDELLRLLLKPLDARRFFADFPPPFLLFILRDWSSRRKVGGGS